MGLLDLNQLFLLMTTLNEVKNMIICFKAVSYIQRFCLHRPSGTCVLLICNMATFVPRFLVYFFNMMKALVSIQPILGSLCCFAEILEFDKKNGILLIELNLVVSVCVCVCVCVCVKTVKIF